MICVKGHDRCVERCKGIPRLKPAKDLFSICVKIPFFDKEEVAHTSPHSSHAGRASSLEIAPQGGAEKPDAPNLDVPVIEHRHPGQVAGKRACRVIEDAVIVVVIAGNEEDFPEVG